MGCHAWDRGSPLPHPDHTVLNARSSLMVDRDPPEPPHDNYPESWETFWQEDDDGELVPMGRTDDGKEFALDTGSPERVEGRCNAPLRDYQRRYGEKRYCTQLPAKKFPGYDTDYCRLHRSMDALEAQWQELFKHGYYAESYYNVAKFLSPTKFLFAVEMVASLFEMSQYDFDVVEHPVTLDTSESALIEEDAVQIDLPLPSNHPFQADQLWQASLGEVEMRKMREVMFSEGLAKSTYADTADVDGEITDTLTEQTEHHLHLPISRLTKDIKEHLKNGGVEIGAEDDSGVITFQKNDYTLDVAPDEETPSDDAQPVSEVAEDFTSELDADADRAAIEVEE